MTTLPYQIINADAVKWANEYQGEPFHAMFCDPPYSLGDGNKGFMNKKWDNDVAFNPDTWRAFKRILYPGAFIFAFAGSRGFHRMMVAIEDAGFVLHPAVFMTWVHGCLSDDTEILTIDGWKHNRDIYSGISVVCYNHLSNSLEYGEIKQVYRYDYHDTAFHIRSNFTDQIVSRGHRCLVKRNGKTIFCNSETLQSKEIVPILEDVPSLQKAVHSERCRRILEEKSLFSEMRNDDKQSKKEKAQKRHSSKTQEKIRTRCSRCMPSLRKRVRDLCVLAEKGKETPNVQQKMRSCSKMARPRTEKKSQRNEHSGHCGSKPRPRYNSKATGKGARREKSILEGRSNLFQKTRELQTHKICKVSRTLSSYGEKRRIYHGTPSISSASTWKMSYQKRGCSPYKSRSTRQSTRKSSVVCKQYRPQTIRGQRVSFTSVDIEPIRYDGVVWCVTVPTGAFVVRRNGKVFVTGNSAFPKATRIDTQIDQMVGAEREVIGNHPNPAGNKKGGNSLNMSVTGMPMTVPMTGLAKDWEGHRYGKQAMKPTSECIVCAQVPYQGKPVENITRTGAGALNIEKGRVGFGNGGEKPVYVPNYSNNIYGAGAGAGGGAWENVSGRWPPNQVFVHNPGCEIIGWKDGQDYQINRWQDDAHPFGNGAGNEFESEQIKAGKIPEYRCVPGCPVATLDQQSGNVSVGNGNFKRNSGADKNGNSSSAYGKESCPAGTESVSYGDDGGASRFFHNPGWEHEVFEKLYQADPFLYESKAGSQERDAGLGDFQPMPRFDGGIDGGIDGGSIPLKGSPPPVSRNVHPTCKPVSLNKHLATLLLPPDRYKPRRLFVPFAGSGSEVIGALLAGWDQVVGVELTPEYIPIAESRLKFWWEYIQYGNDDPVKILANAAENKKQNRLGVVQLGLL